MGKQLATSDLGGTHRYDNPFVFSHGCLNVRHENEFVGPLKTLKLS
jgi:hypothetical protein